MHYEVNPRKDAEMLGKLLSNPQIKKHLVQRTICIAVALFLWIYINGGNKSERCHGICWKKWHF